MTKDPGQVPSADASGDELETQLFTSSRPGGALESSRSDVRRNVAANTAPASAAAAVSGKGSPAERGSGTLAKFALGIVLGGVMGGSVYPLAERSHANQVAQAAPRPTVVAEPAPQPPPSAAETASAEPPAAATPAPEPAVAEAPSSAADASAESALLQAARARLQGGDAAGAQVALEQLRRRFPHGELAQERALLRIEAQKALGQLTAAKRSARAFALTYPNSPQLPSLEPLLLSQ